MEARIAYKFSRTNNDPLDQTSSSSTTFGLARSLARMSADSEAAFGYWLSVLQCFNSSLQGHNITFIAF